LAEDGYVELARNRLNILDSLSNALAELEDTDAQAIFSTITSIDFTNYESINSAKTAIEQYA